MWFIKKLSFLFLNKVFAQKLVSYLVLIIFFYLIKDFWLVIFLTFVFSYLFLTFGTFLKSKLDLFINKAIRTNKNKDLLKKFFSTNILIIFLYLTFISVLFFALSDILPKLTKELRDLPKYVPMLGDYVNVAVEKLEEFKNINTQIWWSLSEVFTKQDMDLILQIFEKIKSVWAIFIKIFLSIILSYIFILDRDKLKIYLKWIEKSNFGFFYREYNIIIKKIVDTFWLVFKAQSMIALTNAILTTIWLLIIWLIQGHSFPFIYTLAIIVFICWFIPVIWTFISSLPILIIWYTTFWWIAIVIEIIFLIWIIHAIEAYYLNPKIVSSFIELPVSLTFLVLIFSEHYMWIAWLVIWISCFYLLIEIFKEIDVLLTKSKTTYCSYKEINENSDNEIKDIRVSRNNTKK